MDGQLPHIQKMFMLSDRLSFITDIMPQLTRMTQFLVLFYTIGWLNASLGTDAPYHDLKFIHQMMDYQAVDNEIAEAALQKVLKHRWYLTAELAVFAMFKSNQNISFETKEEMAKTVLQATQPEVFRTGKPVFVHIDRSTKLFDLIRQESCFFLALTISHDWLSLPCREWETAGNFCCAREFVRAVKVINDAAERGVKLNIDCAAIITGDV